jgi:hypothetical protein
MLIFTAEGPRSIDPADVIAIYAAAAMVATPIAPSFCLSAQRCAAQSAMIRSLPCNVCLNGPGRSPELSLLDLLAHLRIAQHGEEQRAPHQIAGKGRQEKTEHDARKALLASKPHV